MGDNKPKNGHLGIGEINTIRDILMGDKFREVERQLIEMRQEMDAVRTEVGDSMNEIRAMIKQNGKNVRVDMLNKVVELENRMVKYHDKTSQKMKKDKADQTIKLSKLFVKIGNELDSKG